MELEQSLARAFIRAVLDQLPACAAGDIAKILDPLGQTIQISRTQTGGLIGLVLDRLCDALEPGPPVTPGKSFCKGAPAR